jgi:hypothetical protein
MINAQVMTILVVFLGVMLGILFNNARASDLSKAFENRFSDLNNRFNDLTKSVDARISDSNRNIEGRMADQTRHIDEVLGRFEKALDAQTKRIERMDENILRLIADHDARLRSLEKTNG